MNYKYKKHKKLSRKKNKKHKKIHKRRTFKRKTYKKKTKKRYYTFKNQRGGVEMPLLSYSVI